MAQWAQLQGLELLVRLARGVMHMASASHPPLHDTQAEVSGMSEDVPLLHQGEPREYLPF
jgi:hypothetical protein